MNATLRVTRLDAHLGAGKRIIVDCPHATTTVTAVGIDRIDARTPLRIAVARHFAEEGCNCTRSLRRRLGLP